MLKPALWMETTRHDKEPIFKVSHSASPPCCQWLSHTSLSHATVHLAFQFKYVRVLEQIGRHLVRKGIKVVLNLYCHSFVEVKLGVKFLSNFLADSVVNEERISVAVIERPGEKEVPRGNFERKSDQSGLWCQHHI